MEFRAYIKTSHLKMLILTVSVLFITISKADALSDQAITSAVFNLKRPTLDLIKDKNRQPKEILTFFNVAPGTVVLDVLAGSGYYSELLSAVVGPEGKVIIHNDKHFLKYYGANLSERLGTGERLANAKRLDISLNNLELKENSIDTIFLVLGYHDFYYVMNESEKIDVEKVLAKFRKFLKPNGVIGIIDHEAVKGAPNNVGNTLHRIDPQLVKREMADAGFVLDGELDILKNTTDDKSKKIWDIPNSKTSRFVLRFKNIK
ncbi:MAG: methyltransferase domain-containing protein [Colwellia sp.]|nr:methyltransferase domain-containing protein [Colwellia sp.]